MRSSRAMSSDDITSSGPHRCLGVVGEATPAEIRAAYRALVKQWHPDRQVDRSPGNLALCAERFRAIQAAYDSLMTPPYVGSQGSQDEATALDPAQLSTTIQTMFTKAKRKACGQHQHVVRPSHSLAQQIGGFKTCTQVAGDGNCALYVTALAMVGLTLRRRLWPEDYNLESFLDDDDALEWWEQMGEAYRAGSNDGAHIIAAAAVLRSRWPEDTASSLRVYEFAHSITEDDLDELGKKVPGCRFEIHVRMARAAPHVKVVGRVNNASAYVNMAFKTGKGGGHFDWFGNGFQNGFQENHWFYNGFQNGFQLFHWFGTH